MSTLLGRSMKVVEYIYMRAPVFLNLPVAERQAAYEHKIYSPEIAVRALVQIEGSMLDHDQIHALRRAEQAKGEKYASISRVLRLGVTARCPY